MNISEKLPYMASQGGGAGPADAQDQKRAMALA
jgi:hypothetical protein